jgi:glycosyltransferase involved in cell wall biosynthesis
VDWREKRLPLWLKNYLSGVVCTTRIKADDLIAKGAPTKKVHLVHLGIDPSDFVLGLSEIPSIRAELGFPPDCLIVGIFGRLIEWKGQSVFIRALSRLQRPDVYGLIVGGTQLNQTSGEQYASELRELAVQEGISDRIHFTGFREDVYRIMQACDIVCHASYREPFGLVIVEAMMAGKPVIASDVTGPREIIIEGATGFLVPPGDTTTMVERLTQLIEDRQLRDRLGFNGRKQALVRFDIEKNLAQLNSKIAEIILGQRNSSF